MRAGRRASRRARWLCGLGLFNVVLWVAILIGSGSGVSGHEELPLLWQSPKDGEAGEGAGRMLGPNGIGVEAATPGHLFVADTGNRRIEELNAWGRFERAWGWEVVASGPDDDAPQNERQELIVSATAGTYKLRYFNAYTSDGNDFQQFTTAIPFTATAAEVQAALIALPSLEPGDVTVSGGPGDAGGSTPYTIEFKGAYADTAIPELEVRESTLSGGSGGSVETLQDGGSFEVCVRSAGDECQEGQRGGYGPGQFSGGSGPVGGVAVDGNGDVYVLEAVPDQGNGQEPSRRVQKFDNDGEFLVMWGGGVDKTTGADRCTKADLEGGDVCGSGVPGTGPGEFEGGAGIAVGPEGNVFVGDSERIQKFDPEGNYLGEVALAGKTVGAMAMDGAGNFFAAYQGENDVRKLSPAGVESPVKFKGRLPRSVATGNGGEVYLVEVPLLGLGGPRILGYEADGSCFICPGSEHPDPFQATAGTDPIGLATSTATVCGIPGEDLYASFSGGGESFLRAHGPPPDPGVCPPPTVPPEIEDQYASSVGTDNALLGAKISPQFWPDAHYYVEYGTGKCSEGGCGQAKPAPPGALLTDQVTNAVLRSAGVALGGLAPATTYHYRFVAKSSGGGPVRGKGGGEEVAPGVVLQVGAEGTFTTFALPPTPQGGCANDAFRNGPAAVLPDCRAYEMVSPADKANGDVMVQNDTEGNPTALNQSSATGDSLTYSSIRAFGDAQSALISTQYLARRDPDPEKGWGSEAISPPQGINFLDIARSLNNDFKAFSPDLCETWVFHGSPTLAPGAVEGFANLYKRQNCGPEAGEYETLTTAEPPNGEPGGYFPELQGVSADGEHAIFRAPDKLTPDAPELAPGPDGAIDLLYEAYGQGQLRFVCRRPNGSVVSVGCVAGTASTNALRTYGREQAVGNAISDDGSKIFWTEQRTEESGMEPPGKLYVRIEGKKTLLLSSGPAQYWGAAADGSAAIFTSAAEPLKPALEALKQGEADLHAFDVVGNHDEVIAGKVYGVMGISEDAGRIYFASGEVLAGGASAEKPNLYLYDEGDFSFIATLSTTDSRAVAAAAAGPLNVEPNSHTAQITPDGLAATFMSTVALTGADNVDAASGEPDAEVFHYDAGSGELRCASCNPTGARPRGREIGEDTQAAAQIPGAQTQLYPVPRVLSEDGARLFFESFGPLVANDTNGKADVYEWEQPGTGTCTLTRPTYSSTAGGCVALISSGQSPSDSTIADTSPDGEDVFFATASALLPRSDPDELVDIYDARVGGGFPPPGERTAPCEGEACQSPPAAPGVQTPASSSYRGPGNPKMRRCPKGKHRVSSHGKRHCVRKHNRHHHRRAAR